MGVGVSNWRLAQAVSRLGQLGVVSGTALDALFVRRLADGDPGGHMRRGLDAFPFPDMARRIWQEYFTPGGKAPDASYPNAAHAPATSPRKLVELCMVSNFVEVFLAKEGHKNPVGINFLEKVQMPHLASIYGAMLAGVGYVLMGAGIPLHIPGVLDAFAAHHAAEYKLACDRRASRATMRMMRFDPADYVEGPLPVSASAQVPGHRLFQHSGRTPCCGAPAGGLTDWSLKAPLPADTMLPRAASCSSMLPGEPVYGERDQVNIAELRELGVPFWLAGGYGNRRKTARSSREWAPQASRWAPHLPSATSPACAPT